MALIQILAKSYENIKEYPLFFFNTIEEYDYSEHKSYSYWIPEAEYFDKESLKYNKISHESIESSTGDTLFAYGRKSEKQPESGEFATLELEPFDSRNTVHVTALFLLYLNKAYNSADKYSFRELLWCLNSYFIDMNVMSDVISQFNQTSIQPFFWNTLKNITLCLSITKQNLIKKYLLSKRIEYTIYSPDSLVEAVSRCYPSLDLLHNNQNIFELIDLVVNSNEYNGKDCEYKTFDDELEPNFFLKVRRWLFDGAYDLVEYDKLGRFMRLFTPLTQIKIVKRYFHAIHTGYVEFSQELLKEFQTNRFENWGIYYHCVSEPSKPINLTIPLLCDNILTFLNSGQTTLQTINGTLDLAYARCDTNIPEVDFGMKYFMPLCNGGAIPNTISFPGFICYEVIYGLNENVLAEESIKTKFIKYLNLFGSKHQVQVCNNIINSFETCPQKEKKSNACRQCADFGVKWLDKWTLKFNNSDFELQKQILNLFLPVNLCRDGAIVSSNNESFDAADFKKKLIKLLDQNFECVSPTVSYNIDERQISLEGGWIISKQTKSYLSMIFSDFLTPLWVKVEPRNNSYVGRHVLDEQIGATPEMYEQERFRGGFPVKIQKMEHDYIYPKIVSVLQEILQIKPTPDNVFNVPYSEKQLRKLKSDFFSFKVSDNSKVFSEKNSGFITGTHSKYDRYCAPKFENDFYSVLQLPFFWCRGKECFKNSLSQQTLSTCRRWSDYTLLHMLEILGYPQVKNTEGGIEPSELIRSFIGMVNKAASLFKRVKCRECNHILFPMGNTQFNRYNNFECRVPTCGQKNKRVYLSQCHHCKVGLIDSRDSAQCPNGWHICPKCLSCCDDAIYEKMASKYILKKIPIPPRIQEKLHHGHNDKGKFFCPNCGGEVIMVVDPHTDRQARVCQQCHTVFPTAIDY